MAKRFTDSAKWTNNKWFFNLSVEDKLFWIFLLDSCDQVGVWEENVELASKIIGYEYPLDTLLKTFERQIHVFKNGRKWWVKDFCDFQYGELKEDSTSKPILSYISHLKKHGLWKEYLKGICTLKEKDKEKDKEKEGGSGGISPFEEFIDLFNHITNRDFKGDSKSKTQFGARIKEGYTLDDFERAITNCFNDPYHKENPKYLTPEFITRAPKLEMYLNYQSPRSGPQGEQYVERIQLPAPDMP